MSKAICSKMMSMSAKLISLFLFILLINGCKNTNFVCKVQEIQAVQSEKANFQLLINALEHYKSDKGKYIDDLKNLIPNYLEKLPDRNNQDAENLYFVSQDEKEFRITFYFNDQRSCLLGGGNGKCEYRSNNNKWSCSY